ncbi:hypothetical protein Tco_0021020 [Tanacetum coccineum]
MTFRLRTLSEVASNLDRGGSKSWRKGLRIMDEGVPDNGGRGSELNRGRRRRLHPLGEYGVTLYTNGSTNFDDGLPLLERNFNHISLEESDDESE